MADQLYLSLWFPNFRLQSLPGALIGVLRQFALIARDGQPNSSLGRVAAASAYPIDWTESPIYQRIFVLDDRAEDSLDSEDSIIENAVAEATEQLHEDTAYEFEMRWMLWLPEPDAGWPDESSSPDARLDATWRLEPWRVRITGFGPEFDEGSYEQNGHIRVDFGLDTPWTAEGRRTPLRAAAGRSGGLRNGAGQNGGGQDGGGQDRGGQDRAGQDRGNDHTDTEDGPIDPIAARHIQQNVEKLLAFTLSVEKHCGISSRLLWTESGEPLAEKLIARLQRLN